MKYEQPSPKLLRDLAIAHLAVVDAEEALKAAKSAKSAVSNKLALNSFYHKPQTVVIDDRAVTIIPTNAGEPTEYVVSEPVRL